MTATKASLVTAFATIIVTSAGAFVAHSWETDSSASNRLTRLETIMGAEADAIKELTAQMRELTSVCVRLTALAERGPEKDR